MIHSLVAWTLSGSAWAEDPPADPAAEPAPDPEPEDPEEDPLTRYRTPFQLLTDRAIGTTSVPSEFDWRKSHVELAGSSSFLLELNNFDSFRAGGLVRIPTGRFLVEIGASYVGVWDTVSSRMLALTPYRQPGRPHRLEVDVTGAFPLAEGVVTTFPRFFPAVEMVFDGYAGIRYLVYPPGFAHLKAREVAGALLAPSLSDKELGNLESERLPAMEVDPGRYGLMVGLGDDLYFHPGLFLSPRLMLGVPLLAPVTETRLLLTADLSLVLGVAL